MFWRKERRKELEDLLHKPPLHKEYTNSTPVIKHNVQKCCNSLNRPTKAVDTFNLQQHKIIRSLFFQKDAIYLGDKKGKKELEVLVHKTRLVHEHRGH